MNKLDIKSIIIGILGTTLIFFLIGATSQDKNFGHINVKSISVINENGIPQIYLTTTEQGGVFAVVEKNNNRCIITENRIMFSNKNEQLLAVLGANDDSQFLQFNDKNGNRTATLFSKNEVSTFWMFDKQESPVISFSSGAEKMGGTFTLENPINEKMIMFTNGQISFLSKGNPTTSIGNNGFYTYNLVGKQTSFLGTGDHGGGLLMTSNSNGKMTVMLGTIDDGNGALGIRNSDGITTVFLGTNEDKNGHVILLDRYGNVGWSETGKK